MCRLVFEKFKYLCLVGLKLSQQREIDHLKKTIVYHSIIPPRRDFTQLGTSENVQDCSHINGTVRQIFRVDF